MQLGLQSIQIYFNRFLVTELPCLPPELAAATGATVDEPEVVKRAEVWKISRSDFTYTDKCDATDATTVRNQHRTP